MRRINYAYIPHTHCGIFGTSIHCDLFSYVLNALCRRCCRRRCRSCCCYFRATMVQKLYFIFIVVEKIHRKRNKMILLANKKNPIIFWTTFCCCCCCLFLNIRFHIQCANLTMHKRRSMSLLYHLIVPRQRHIANETMKHKQEFGILYRNTRSRCIPFFRSFSFSFFSLGWFFFGCKFVLLFFGRCGNCRMLECTNITPLYTHVHSI